MHPRSHPAHRHGFPGPGTGRRSPQTKLSSALKKPRGASAQAGGRHSLGFSPAGPALMAPTGHSWVLFWLTRGQVQTATDFTLSIPQEDEVSRPGPAREDDGDSAYHPEGRKLNVRWRWPLWIRRGGDPEVAEQCPRALCPLWLRSRLWPSAGRAVLGRRGPAPFQWLCSWCSVALGLFGKGVPWRSRGWKLGRPTSPWRA